MLMKKKPRSQGFMLLIQILIVYNLNIIVMIELIYIKGLYT